MMEKHQALITIASQQTPGYLEMLGQAANSAASSNALADYQARKTAETLRRQRADIQLFERYVNEALAPTGEQVEQLADDLSAWRFLNYGLVEGFIRWQLSKGYAIGSVNVRLSTVKTYCTLAAKTGALPAGELTLIKTVKGYRGKEGRNQDEKRAVKRVGAKKAEPTALALDQARTLKQQPDTPKGRRDALILALLLDYGLRVSEVADLDIESFNLVTGELTFYRKKVDVWQTLALAADTLAVARAYLEQEGRESGPLFTGSLTGKERQTAEQRISTRTINARLAALGLRQVKVKPLSPHDCRHYWATNAIRTGTDVKSLQDAGGWSNPAQPLRYAASARIANAGVKLTK